MIRRTISLPDSVDNLVGAMATDGESYSATVARLIEDGARQQGQPRRPSYVASGTGPADLARRAEEYLREFADSQ